MSHTHQSHPEVVKRLKRANGHLRKIIEMIEAETPCIDVAQQLQAVYNAIGNAKRVFVQDHIEGCLTDDGSSTDELKQKMHELKDISKYL